MRTRKIAAAALLALTMVGGTANAAFARQGRGADDPIGHVRGGHGADDGAGHVRHGGGADDGLNHR
ncbi:MAG TPA: hypothetical protein VHS52_04800 [Acidimicrobiales bacterium]|nr:hypothetical protein [Acidimicrobiales bacterium]